MYHFSDDRALPSAPYNHLHFAHLASRDWFCPLLWRTYAQDLEVTCCWQSWRRWFTFANSLELPSLSCWKHLLLTNFSSSMSSRSCCTLLLCLFEKSPLYEMTAYFSSWKKQLFERIDSTSRISVIFRVRSAKAVKITDMDLIKRQSLFIVNLNITDYYHQRCS